MEKLGKHMEWLQAFCTTLVEKSLLRRNEPKPAKEDGPKRRRRSSAAVAAEKGEKKPAKGPGSRGGKTKRAKKSKVVEEEPDEDFGEEDDEYESYENGDWVLGPLGVNGREPEGDYATSLSVGELLGLVGASRGLHGLASASGAGPSGHAPPHEPILTLPAHLASHLASPLAIYDTDFDKHSGCLSSPHHFLSPRTVEQLNAEGGLSSAELRAVFVREEGEEAAAACLSGRMQLPSHTSHTRSQPNLHAPTRSGIPNLGAASRLPGPLSAPPRIHCAAPPGSAAVPPPPAPSAASSGSSGTRSAVDMAESVYEAIGGLATLAAAAPAPRPGKRARLDPYRATASGEVDPGFAGAGVSERRKPAGLCNLQLPSANSSAPAVSSSLRPMPFSAGSAGSSSHSSSSAGVVAFAAVVDPFPTAMPFAGPPASARTVAEIASLVSPAFGTLGVSNAFSLNSAHSARLQRSASRCGEGGMMSGLGGGVPSPKRTAASTVASPCGEAPPPSVVDLVAC